jgi:hypothetical protein
MRFLDAADTSHSARSRWPIECGQEGPGRRKVARSENAVAVLRFRVKGHRLPATGRRVPAYRELVEAGIMLPVRTFIGGAEALFRFTWQGLERRHEFQRPLPRLSFSASAIARSLFLAISRMADAVSAGR